MAKTRNIEAVRESLIRKEAVSVSTNLDHCIFGCIKRDARGETKHEKNATIHHENLRMGLNFLLSKK